MDKDSAYFRVAPNNFLFIKKIVVRYNGQDLQRGESGIWNLIVPLQDTLGLRSRLIMKTIMNNGDTLLLKNIHWIDLRKR